MNCFIGVPTGNTAKEHIDALMGRMGFKDLGFKVKNKGKISTFTAKTFSIAKLPFTLKKGDVLLIQYPFKKYYKVICRIAHLKGAKTITLIHDLGTFRRHKLTAEQEIKKLSLTDSIIVHNCAMNKWLVNHGCKVPLTNLDIFDYISNSQPTSYAIDNPPSRIVYAGSISARKNAFLYKLDDNIKGCTVNLYGRGIDTERASKWKNMHYIGFVESDKFISEVTGDWGLVWDGDDIDGCSGNWGEYLRINNPHKTSFYLRSGLPVIIWKESAMVPFIEANYLGIAVNSLREVPEILNNMSQQDYSIIKNNVMEFKGKLDDGVFFKKAYKKAKSYL